uniref:aspartyl aminopeptidase n=1 Tax=Babesia bovis TaxID=5865 RepID=A7ASI8_BABBO|eukprot:XP_001611075.1 aspartyl aminopeptidase [Babesia bovis T2Bo]
MSLKESSFNSAQRFVRSILPYLDNTGSPAHSVVELEKFLKDNFPEAKKLNRYEKWSLVKGGTYYLYDHNATMMAFHVGKGYNVENKGIVIAAGHTDSPALKLEYKSENVAHAFNQPGVLEERLIRIEKPIIVVPNLSVHLQTSEERQVLKLNKEKHLRGVVATEAVHNLHSNGSHPVLGFIAKELGVKVEDIVDMDLCMFDITKSSLSGLYEEFLSSARLDNLASCFSVLGGFVDFVKSNGWLLPLITYLKTDYSNYITCVIFYNYEEMGSLMASGANSDITIEWIKKIFNSMDSSFEENKDRAMVLNVDMSHAVHPNHSERHSDTHQPHFHEGLVMKRNINGRYATELRAAAVVIETAREAGIPIQDFRVPNDSPCGSTVGPFLSSRLCVPVVDVGIPQLAMHSIREICSTVDMWHLKEVVRVSGSVC